MDPGGPRTAPDSPIRGGMGPPRPPPRFQLGILPMPWLGPNDLPPRKGRPAVCRPGSREAGIPPRPGGGAAARPVPATNPSRGPVLLFIFILVLPLWETLRPPPPFMRNNAGPTPRRAFGGGRPRINDGVGPGREGGGTLLLLDCVRGSLGRDIFGRRLLCLQQSENNRSIVLGMTHAQRRRPFFLFRSRKIQG